MEYGPPSEFFGVKTELVEETPYISAILSAAEMLFHLFPKLSGTFLHYAHQLLENFSSIQPPSPKISQALQILRNATIHAPKASPEELIQFGDSLIKKFPTSPELNQLAFIAYASTSLFQPISPQVGHKINHCAAIFAAEPQSNHQNPTLYPDLPSISASSSIDVTKVNHSNTNNSSSISSKTNISPPNRQKSHSNINDPSKKINSSPNIQNSFPGRSQSQNYTNTSTQLNYPNNPSQSNIQNPQNLSSNSGKSVSHEQKQAKIDPSTERALELIDLARAAFKGGARAAAYTAILAAMKELDSPVTPK